MSELVCQVLRQITRHIKKDYLQVKDTILDVSTCPQCSLEDSVIIKCSKCGNLFEMVSMNGEGIEHDPKVCHEIKQSASEKTETESEEELVQWCDQYILGMNDIDHQHKGIVDIINKIHRNVISGKSDQNLINNLLKELDQHLEHHFTYEEALYRETKYPELNQQILEHQLFSAQVKHLIAEFSNYFFDLRFVLKFMSGGFIEHLQFSDKRFVEFWHNHLKQPQSK